jgi:Icc-related predicted phosphoesterase
VTDIIRVAAIGDLHCAKTTVPETFKPLFTQVSELADVLVLCGDLTDYGLPEEARLLARELAAARVPIVAVFGNHDYESDNADEVSKILNGAGVTLLDGDGVEVKGIGFAGCKGFAGGFGERALQAWGEPTIKAFVRVAVDEALKLERALARLRTPRRVAVLHYAPIAATVAGEYPEIAAFLGSSRLEEPINRYNVSAVVHGHAHRGQPEGVTSTGVPVYNVAMPLLRRCFPDRPPFRIIEIPVERPPQLENGGGNGATAHVPAGGPSIAKIA